MNGEDALARSILEYRTKFVLISDTLKLVSRLNNCTSDLPDAFGSTNI
jgi:hypothetical protein